MLEVELDHDPRPPWVKCPDSAIQKVTASRRLFSIRSKFEMGPFTCVDTAKAVLGIRAFWVRTPWQLYRYIQKRSGVIISGT